MSDDIELPRVPSDDEKAALALLQQYAAADLRFRLAIYASKDNRLDGGAVDMSGRRDFLRRCLADLARKL